MRILNLAKSGWNKIHANQRELKAADMQDSVKSLPPGEWCGFSFQNNDLVWIGFVNPLIDEKYSCIHILHSVKKSEIQSFSEEASIEERMSLAYQKRLKFSGYEDGARMFYGMSDGLPGLIIDTFKNKAVIQINTAGVDRHRELIRKKISELIGGDAYLLDNAKYREKEFLPSFEVEKLPGLEVVENGLQYRLRAEVIQKVGFYYDHRENRNQLINLLSRLKKIPERGVDLFCYAGAWGMSALKGGVKIVDFVDQGDFNEEISTGLELNNFTDRGAFFRQDVFKFLDESISGKKSYDLILCDPPAFAKTHLQKDQALEGYSKLHRRVLKVAAPGAVLAFSSCTHYVSHEEFQKNVLDAAHKENKKLQLLYCGLQGWDHPIARLEDRSSYIKSYFYLME